MDNRVVTAIFKHGEVSCVTLPLYQYDYGQELHIEGVELPTVCEVHFSNDQYGESTTSICNDGVVSVPDMYLVDGRDIYAWVFLHDTENDGETEYKILIPVRARASVTDVEPTPEEQSVITETIAALNAAVSESETNVTHYPKIVNGYWYVWDAEQGTWVNTEVKAQGEAGDPSVLIDDTEVSSSKTYSSEKMQELMLFDVTNVQFPRS